MESTFVESTLLIQTCVVISVGDSHRRANALRAMTFLSTPPKKLQNDLRISKMLYKLQSTKLFVNQ